MSILRKIGAVAAIAALPGLLSEPLPARQEARVLQAIAARPVANVPAAAVRLATPGSIEPTSADRQTLELHQNSFTPPLALLGPGDAASGRAEFLPRPAAEQPVAASPAFASPIRAPQAGAAADRLAERAFRLQDVGEADALTASSPLVRGPYDRLSPDYVALPKRADRGLGMLSGLRSGGEQSEKPPVLQELQVRVSESPIVAENIASTPEGQRAPEVLLAKADVRAVKAAAQPAAPPREGALPLSGASAAIAPSSPAALPPAAPASELAARQQQNFDLRPGTRTFPVDESEPAFTSDDELILQFKIKGIDASDTIIAYGTRKAVYLPLGEIARILDLAIRVSDEGHYANGWFLNEERTLTINLREQVLITAAGRRPLKSGEVQAFDGEMFLRSELFGEIFPIDLTPDLRAQAVYVATREPFPFEERMRREAERARLGARDARPDQARWPRQTTPWLAASMPIADVELRAVSDSPLGDRIEGDLRLGADLAFMTAQSYFSATTRDGLVASLVQFGRRDADGGLLGPLDATDFQFGDVATSSLPVGLRGQAGRGAYVTNRPFQNASVFERIDLRGILPNGYEVELYRNDILVGSVATAVNDQYEFLEVPVDYGLNVFRLVFYGPQGQRREEVRRITIGDGRLAKGQFEYDVGIVQRGENLLGVRGPNFNPLEGFGSWQATARLSYGLSSDITAVTSLAYFEEDGGDLSVATAGLRTGLGALAIRADGALGSDGSSALGLGLGGRLLGGALSLSHFEYGGGFRDEILSNSRDPLRRATELDFNGSIRLSGQAIPIAARLRHIAFASGRVETDAILRSSYRVSGVVLSNTLEFSRNTNTGGPGFSQLIGNFDLATLGRSRVQLRASLGYSLLQGPEITNASGEVAYQVDNRTIVSGQAFHSFATGEFGFGVSAAREFDRFTLAIDGNYAFEQRSYSVALRIGFSFGRDPLKRGFFMAPPGQASSGAVSLRAFQDMDGNGAYGTGDVPLKDVTFSVFNDTVTSDDEGMARLTRLGNGNPVAVQVDPSSLPDILMAPASRGIEIVPRPGRFHVMDFPIVALSEIEGTVTFEGAGTARGVSGLRLLLIDDKGEVAGSARTERGGYYFFEQIKPGRFTLALDPQQAARLGVCMAGKVVVEVSPSGDIYTRNAVVRECT